MIRLRFVSCFIACLLAVISIWSCKQDHDPAVDRMSDKEYPNDLFTFQRSYPYRKFDIKAYDAGLKQAQQALQSRSASPGFDEAWTNVGPGNYGGRVNTVAVHPSDEDIIYLGFATGGVFKTTDGGSSWTPIFDDQSFLAIGDIALDPLNPNIIYVGTGDPNISGYPAIGDGLYRSTDGGATWTYLGLQDQRIISKIIIDPSDTDVIYVSGMGLPFERNNDRGLYKSQDWGTSWQQVLFVSNQSGIIDMVMDPTDPLTLYASSWDRIRNNEESTVAGPNGKIHKTTDGGLTWTTLTNGLPSGTVGRIGLDISLNNPDVLVCVYIDSGSDLLGVYKTEDGGDTWSTIPIGTGNGLSSNVMGGFGWYFGQIRLHPSNDDWFYLLGVQAWFTSTNGMFWTLATGSGAGAPHVDYHDLVFNFQNDIIIGNDGGAYKRESSGSTYFDIEDLPATQIYRTAYDPHRPENFYGGTQDNGTLAGTATSPDAWYKLLGGDGFQMQFDPVDSNITYTESQRGNIFRGTNGLGGYFNATSGIISSDRRHWDMQYFISPHSNNRLYTGTYRVYKSDTEGMPSWSPISDDLTDGIIHGTAFHTISTLDESPQVEGLLYVGTTDANVWRSEDGGSTWDSIHMSLPERYITSVKADPDSSDRVFVCVSGYRYNEYTPRVYRSDDRGNTWTSIAGNLPDLAVNDIIILPGQNSQVLFVATDGGIYATTNGGSSWERLGSNMPMVTSYDLTVNEVQNKLVASTFGRSIYTYPIDSFLNNIPGTFAINGQVINSAGTGIDSVIVEFGNAGLPAVQADADGYYQLNEIPIGSFCEVRPAKNINIRNGISTFDMLLMQQHILLIDTLDTPYQVLAGDVSGDGNLSTFDIVINRKVLLEIQDTFINVPSWNFVAADYTFQNPFDPFEEDYFTVVTCDSISAGASANFIGFKMGDVNASANPAGFDAAAEERSLISLPLSLEDRVLKAGRSYDIPIKTKEDVVLNGLQLGLKLASDIQFLEVKGTSQIDIQAAHYHYKEASRELLLSWSDPISAKLKKNETLIYLKIKSLSDVHLSEAVQILDERFPAEAYGENGQLYQPLLLFQEQKFLHNSAISISPNPLSEHGVISFEAKEEGRGILRIYSRDGQLRRSEKLGLAKGKNRFELRRSDFVRPGVYFIQLETTQGLYSDKLLVY